MHERNVGKPSLDAVVGEGTSKQISMTHAGGVYVLSNDVKRDSISRDPGQDKPHMKVETDVQGICHTKNY